MKKIICLVLSLMLCLPALAMAESTPSRTAEDLLYFEVSGNGNILPIHEATTGVDIEGFQTWLDISAAELEKLQAAENDAQYFQNVVDEQGNPVDPTALLGVDGLYVYEFYPLLVYGYEAGCGEQTVTMHFPTFYEQGEPVAVLLGFVKELSDADNAQSDRVVEWVMLPATAVEDGAVQVVLSEEMVLTIQENVVLLAVASGEK